MTLSPGHDLARNRLLLKQIEEVRERPAAERLADAGSDQTPARTITAMRRRAKQIILSPMSLDGVPDNGLPFRLPARLVAMSPGRRRRQWPGAGCGREPSSTFSSERQCIAKI